MENYIPLLYIWATHGDLDSWTARVRVRVKWRRLWSEPHWQYWYALMIVSVTITVRGLISVCQSTTSLERTWLRQKRKNECAERWDSRLNQKITHGSHFDCSRGQLQCNSKENGWRAVHKFNLVECYADSKEEGYLRLTWVMKKRDELDHTSVSIPSVTITHRRLPHIPHVLSVIITKNNNELSGISICDCEILLWADNNPTAIMAMERLRTDR